MRFAEHLRQLRGDMTLMRLAKESGVARSYLYQMESGKSSPTLEIVERLAEAFHMTVLEMLEPIYSTIPCEPPFPLAT